MMLCSFTWADQVPGPIMGRFCLPILALVALLPAVQNAHSQARLQSSQTNQTPQAGHPIQAAPFFQGKQPDHGTRANSEANAQGWMAPYLQRVDQTFTPEPEFPTDTLPTGFRPWWNSFVSQRFGNQPGLTVGVDWLVQSALQNSSHVQAVIIEPKIRQTELVEELAAFDWSAYLNSRYDDFNDPVGNTLTTGNNDDRFVDRKWSTDGGLRRKTHRGGDLSLSQRAGSQQNNSRFLFPNPQATTRLELAYTQPLLNGAGRPYNESRIVLASIDADSAQDDVVKELQEHLLQVTETYWDLYRSRAEYLQQQRVLREAQSILNDLLGRQGVDSLERQVLRAKAAVANRNSKMARAGTSIRNASAQLRLLVNDPLLTQSAAQELSPSDIPVATAMSISMHDGLHTALVNRPDISRAIRDMRTTTTRLGVAKNEILPKLDLLVSSYVAGLEGDRRVIDAFSNQFSDGRPGYSVGLQFEMPLGNRAAQARWERQNLELARATSKFRATVEASLTETEIAVREVHTCYREMVAKGISMQAAEDETRFLIDRWRTLPGLDDSATLLLEDLLDSQERRADEESEFVRAQVNYSISLVRLRKSLGTLLRCEPVEQGSGTDSNAYPQPLPEPTRAALNAPPQFRR